ncbi:uncharacterized protein LOC143291718 [Babylonia areolata]|uniref:uncharacterized protein LOC143291718 n=1 Tax=Babylonia areolata TaxID=304850 RepID=UPI003FCF2C1D
MEYHVASLEFLLLWILVLTGELRGATEVLKCYDCSDTFRARWDPYTDCQLNVSAVPVATCLESDQYCKVERVSVKGTGATISISRSCAGDCYYGCLLYGYGVSQMRCTTCCNHTLCNTDSGAAGAVLLRGWGCSALGRRGLLISVLLGVMVMLWTRA